MWVTIFEDYAKLWVVNSSTLFSLWQWSMWATYRQNHAVQHIHQLSIRQQWTSYHHWLSKDKSTGIALLNRNLTKRNSASDPSCQPILWGSHNFWSNHTKVVVSQCLWIKPLQCMSVHLSCQAISIVTMFASCEALCNPMALYSELYHFFLEDSFVTYSVYLRLASLDAW